MDIKWLMEQSFDISKAHGWWDSDPHRSFAECIALVHSELSEALQEYRDNHGLNEIYMDDKGAPQGVPIELADAVIRICDICEGYGIDLVAALDLKSIYNAKRPYRHGGKRM